jgi:CTP synthase
MQCAAIEIARHVVGLPAAHSTEFFKDTPHPVICLLDEQRKITDMGGTMRLGAQPCQLVDESKSRQCYDRELVSERHRHRYEFNNVYRQQFAAHGVLFAGTSNNNELVEIIELSEHPFHPEFKSKPTLPHPLFSGFIEAAIRRSVQRSERNQGIPTSL